MFSAGIKKEVKLLSRGFKIWGILITIVGLALVYPLLYKSLEVMTQALSDMSGEAGISMDETMNYMDGMMNEMAALYGGSMASVGFYTGAAAFTSEGFLVVSLLLMATAGGEQKKRSTIMPNCAGLTPAGYIMPKFVIYPVLIGLLSFGGVFLTSLVSNGLFEGQIMVNDALFSGVCVGVFMMFMIAVYFLFGICTGRPGIGVVVMYLGASLVPIILSIFDITSCNPFALRDMLMSSYAEADMKDFTISLIVTVVLSVICCLISLVVTTLRKIDNAAGEANL